MCLLLLEESLFSATHIFAVTEKGYGKRVPIDEFRTQRRGGKGTIIIKFKSKVGGGGIKLRKANTLEANFEMASSGALSSSSGGAAEGDALSCMRLCSAGDEVVLSTKKGTIIRQRVDDLSIQSRTATGVLIQKIAKDDVIVMVDIVPSGSSNGSDSNNNNGEAVSSSATSNLYFKQDALTSAAAATMNIVDAEDADVLI